MNLSQFKDIVYRDPDVSSSKSFMRFRNVTKPEVDRWVNQYIALSMKRKEPYKSYKKNGRKYFIYQIYKKEKGFNRAQYLAHKKRGEFDRPLWNKIWSTMSSIYRYGHTKEGKRFYKPYLYPDYFNQTHRDIVPDKKITPFIHPDENNKIIEHKTKKSNMLIPAIIAGGAVLFFMFKGKK